MESNNAAHLTIVGQKELIEICIYNTNVLTGSNIRLIDFNDEDMDIGVIEFKRDDYLALFKFGMFYQEYRFLSAKNWEIPTG